MLKLVYQIGQSVNLKILLPAIRHLIMKKLGIVIIMLLFGILGTAQNQGPRNEFWSNVRFGGSLGLGFGNDSFNIAIAPSAIYQVSPQFATGLGLSYNYSEYDDFKFSAWGGSVMTFFNPIPALQLSAEFEEIRVSREEVFFGNTFEDDYWSPALFFGIGFGNRNVMVGVRYDVLHDDGKSIYIDPWIPFVRVYF